MKKAILIAVLTLAGCGQNEFKPQFDGYYFKAKLSKVERLRHQFEVRVSPISQSLDGAREAGRYEATKYCIKQYGSSDMKWVNGPDDLQENLLIDGDTLYLRGACDI